VHFFDQTFSKRMHMPELLTENDKFKYTAQIAGHFLQRKNSLGMVYWETRSSVFWLGSLVPALHCYSQDSVEEETQGLQ
jgi:hypothetical protein